MVVIGLRLLASGPILSGVNPSKQGGTNRLSSDGINSVSVNAFKGWM